MTEVRVMQPGAEGGRQPLGAGRGEERIPPKPPLPTPRAVLFSATRFAVTRTDSAPGS